MVRYVYVVLQGELGEGASIVSVAASIAGARKFAKSIVNNDTRSFRKWEQLDDNTWQQGCDSMFIERHEVHNGEYYA